ncbi:hypothetical protein [Leptospira noguchii]|uniref:hypothetical protein n=1 Tax=Leptospira noguchii TaxID=28182 RepID=UPI0003148D89|nr:hypothetical protein [Leptospira noguchii]
MNSTQRFPECRSLERRSLGRVGNSTQRFPECRSLERHSLSSLGRVVESSY